MAEININELPSNSYSSKKKTDDDDKKLPEKKVEAVVQGRRKKRGLGRRIADTFVADDVTTGSVKEYILGDVIVPAVVDLFLDVVQNSLEMIFFGTAKGYRKRKSDTGKNGKVNYKGMSEGKRDISRRSRSLHDFDDVQFDSKGEAEEVLDRLVEYIDDYGQATVADFYNLAGVTSDFTDQKYGWTNLSEAKSKRINGGYIVVLPKPVEL